MKLHENPKFFNQAIRATTQQLGIAEIYIEKDYWVCLALKAIFSGEAGKAAVFKGGTAISKCYRVIERFSEDIDMVVLNNGESANQLKNKLKAIGKAVNEILPEIPIDGITNKLGMIRKTAHEYPKVFKGNYGQVRDKLIVEATWLGHSEPFVMHKIGSFIYDMMWKSSQDDLAIEYEMEPFEVRVLDIRRTFCEKIMSLVRFSQTEHPIDDLRMKVRHLYDLHQLLRLDEIKDFVDSSDFETMLQKVGNDDVKSFKNNNRWLANHPKNAIIFSDTKNVMAQLKSVYENDFSALLYGPLPTISQVTNSINLISQRIQGFKWDIDLVLPSNND